jgi:hypothetical protein
MKKNYTLFSPLHELGWRICYICLSLICLGIFFFIEQDIILYIFTTKIFQIKALTFLLNPSYNYTNVTDIVKNLIIINCTLCFIILLFLSFWQLLKTIQPGMYLAEFRPIIHEFHQTWIEYIIFLICFFFFILPFVICKLLMYNQTVTAVIDFQYENQLSSYLNFIQKCFFFLFLFFFFSKKLLKRIDLIACQKKYKLFLYFCFYLSFSFFFQNKELIQISFLLLICIEWWIYWNFLVSSWTSIVTNKHVQTQLKSHLLNMNVN